METNDKLLEGRRYGKLTIIKYLYTKNRSKYFLCKCDCGNMKEININNLKSGRTKSCGCYNIKKLKERAKTNKYDLTKNYGIGYTSNTNEPFYFDLEDYDKIKKYCWYKDAYGYLVNIHNRKNIKLHKLITATNSKQAIDHINRNKLDNRKENLRIATYSLNCFNRTYNKEQVGVYFNKEKNKWEAKIMFNYKNIHLGYFNNKQEAIEMRRKAELLYFGEYNNKENYVKEEK